MVPKLLAAQPEPSEYAVKAAFLLNFARFVEWPSGSFDETTSPIVLGVLGADPFGRLLDDTVRGKVVAGRSLVVGRFTERTMRKPCHLLFVSREYDGDVRALVSTLAAEPVLTVSDREDFLAEGGAIRLLLVDDTVRFEVSRRAADASGLGLSSRLLAVARAVVGAARDDVDRADGVDRRRQVDEPEKLER